MLSFPIRVPDCLQAEALRLLDASRPAINQLIADLWPQLDAFAGDRTGIAWKQVEQEVLARSGHGSRQERREMEQAGRFQELFHQLCAYPLPNMAWQNSNSKFRRAIRNQARHFLFFNEHTNLQEATPPGERWNRAMAC